MTTRLPCIYACTYERMYGYVYIRLHNCNHEDIDIFGDRHGLNPEGACWGNPRSQPTCVTTFAAYLRRSRHSGTAL